MELKGKAVNKYLENYSEPETGNLSGLTNIYRYAIVIPVCNEKEDFLDNVFSINSESSVLVVLVINSPIENINSPYWQKQNFRLINKLESNAKTIKKLSVNCKLLQPEGSHDILIVDRNSRGLQIKDQFGVGLARKVGCDIALKLHIDGVIISPWIYSTDADVILPEDYFSDSVRNTESCSAVVLDFKHITEDKELASIQYLYDFKIRYYHAGVTYAGCKYDYIPLGSTLIINMKYYPMVRGFSKRSAGEDFYLLNKLNKIRPVLYRNDGGIILINSRISDRVPFGTGPALKYISQLNSSDDYHYYNPQCFIYLKQWNEFLASLWEKEGMQIIKPEEPFLHELFLYLDCRNVFEKCRNQITSHTKWQDFLHHWFDAFKTLKAVHFFDKKFPRLNMRDLLNSTSFDKVSNFRLYNFIQSHVSKN